VGHNKQISGELRIIFVQSVKIYSLIFIYYPKDSLLMYQKFYYFVQNLTLISFTSWVLWRKN